MRDTKPDVRDFPNLLFASAPKATKSGPGPAGAFTYSFTTPRAKITTYVNRHGDHKWFSDFGPPVRHHLRRRFPRISLHSHTAR
jgi:hypothetical protein